MPDSGVRKQPEPDTGQISLVTILEREKTRRFLIVSIALTISFVTLVTAATIIYMKHMDDPPWFKLATLIIGPHGIASVLYITYVVKLRRHIASLEKQMQSLLGQDITDNNRIDKGKGV